MPSTGTPVRDDLDDLVNQAFAGKVVRKDLVRKVKVGANVPVFVLEFLLGKYCASTDPVAIEMGLQVVNDTLAENYIRPDESMKAQSRVMDKGHHSFIDKVKVRVAEGERWAEAVNFGDRFMHIPTHYARDFERLLTGGVWAQVDVNYEYDDDSKGRHSFWIAKLEPIQIATFDLEEYRACRRSFTTEQWIDLIVRSMGYVVQEVSPYSSLLTGPTTVANLFGHMSGRQKGMVQIWDVVGFDEVADLQKMPKEVITTMKTYCESGSYQRGTEGASGDASIAIFGNTNQPIEVMVQSGHLFEPMPDVIRNDMAFIDRLHCYLPGWELPKMRAELLTDHYGFVVDYLAEALRELRKHNFTEISDRHFSLGSHLNTRDRKAVRKTVSGLVKIIHPHGEVADDEIAELLEFAIEGRRRVKEQLKKMGSFEYYQTSFSYVIDATGEERFVGVPEQGGRDLISLDPLAPGSAYAAGVTGDGTVGMFRIEVSVSAGTGKLKLAGGVGGAMRESVQRAFAYMQTHRGDLALGRDFDNSDFHLEVIDLLTNRVEAEIGVGFFAAIMSALRGSPLAPALLILGDMSVQGNIKPVRSLVEPLQVAMDNGAKRALIPIENKRSFLEVEADIVEHVDPIFYGDPRTAALKALGIS
jgi:ATP-dependent Lon protease